MTSSRKVAKVGVSIILLTSLINVLVHSGFKIFDSVQTQSESHSNRIGDGQTAIDPNKMQSIVERRIAELKSSGDLLTTPCDFQLYFFKNINTCFRATLKSGHTNWKEALLLANGDISHLARDRKEHHDFHKYSIKYLIEKLNITENAAILKDAIWLTTIRNPWVRMVSGYTNKIVKKQGNAFSGIRKTILANAGIAEEVTPTFREFAEWIAENNGKVNAHFMPQTKAMCLHDTSYHYIIPQEYTQEYSDVIFRAMDLNTSVPHSYDGTSVLTQSSTINAKEWFPQLDAALIDKLYQIFKPDFLLMKYTNFTDPSFPFPLIGI